MSTQAGFIFKVLLVSTVLSIFIKYGGEYIPIEANAPTAIAIVLSPSIAIGFLLGWQYMKENKK